MLHFLFLFGLSISLISPSVFAQTADAKSKWEVFQQLDKIETHLKVKKHNDTQLEKSYERIKNTLDILQGKVKSPEKPAQIFFPQGKTLDLGNITNGQTKNFKVVLENNGELVATSLKVSGLSYPFSYRGGAYPGIGGSCSNTLTSLSSCTISFTAKAVKSGIINRAIYADYFNGLVNKKVRLDIKLNTVEPAQLILAEPDPFSFGDVVLGRTSEHTFTVNNSGESTASSMRRLKVDGPFGFKGGVYPGKGGDCTSTLAPGAVCNLVLLFKPEAVGSSSGKLLLSYNNGRKQSKTGIGLTGLGVSPAVLSLNLADPYDFGTVARGSYSNVTFALVNTGSSAATNIFGASLPAPFEYSKTSVFPGEGGTCALGESLPTGSSCTLVVSYSPTSNGVHWSSLEIYYFNGFKRVKESKSLQGISTSPAILSVVDANPFDFGVRAVGSSVTHTFTIINNGNLTATSIGSVSTVSSPFQFPGGRFPGSSGTCWKTLAPSASCTIEIDFKPTTNTISSEVLNINYFDGSLPQVMSQTLEGEGANPAHLVLSPDPFDFGDVAAGGVRSQTFTLTNSGDFSASSLVSQPFNEEFMFRGGGYPGVGGNCGSSLAPSASCYLVISFFPTHVGLQVDHLQIDYDKGTGVISNTKSTVEGVGRSSAILSMSMASIIDFGDRAVGSSTEFTITVTNNGFIDATGLIGVGLYKPFYFPGGYPGGGTCTAKLAGGSSCTLKVAFSPTQIGHYNDALDLNYFDGVSKAVLSKSIIGNGQSPALLTISEGKTYNFGQVAIGGLVDRVFTVNHSGGMKATLVSGGGLASPFVYKGGSYPGTGGSCSGTISSACTIVVSFAPSISGLMSDTIELDYFDGAASVQATRNIQGAGVTPAYLSISDPEPFNYGTTTIGSSREHTFSISNNGGADAKSIAISGLAAPFDYSGGQFPGGGGSCSLTMDLAGGSSCTVVINFSPTAVGLQLDTMNLNYFDGVTTQIEAQALQGTSVSPGLIVISETDPFDFGTVAYGGVLEHTFTLSNVGASDVKDVLVSGIEKGSAFNFKGGGFPGTGGDCSVVIPSGSPCSIVVEYSPKKIGYNSGVITVGYSDGASQQYTVRDIAGSAVQPASLTISESDSYSFGRVTVNSITDHTFIITNTGGIDATDMASGFLTLPFEFRGGGYPGLGGDCGRSISPLQSCNIVVAYLPTVVSSLDTDSISINYNDGVGANTTSRSIEGTAITRATLAISGVDPTNFGSISVGARTELTFTLSNFGDSDVSSISESSLTPPFSLKGGEFPGSGGTCSTVLRSASSCIFVVEFVPTRSGLYSGNISFDYFDGVVTQSSRRSLVGTATQSAQIVISDASPYNYGTVDIGKSISHIFTITNVGGSDATNVNASSLSQPFNFVGGVYPGGGTCMPGGTLPPVASCTMVVEFSPQNPGFATDDLEVSYDTGSNLGSVEFLELQGTGVLATSPGRWNWTFYGIQRGGTSSQTTPELTVHIQSADVPIGTKVTFYEDALCLMENVSSIIYSEYFSQYFVFANDGSDDGVKQFYGKLTFIDGSESSCDYLTHFTLKTQNINVSKLKLNKNKKVQVSASINIKSK